MMIFKKICGKSLKTRWGFSVKRFCFYGGPVDNFCSRNCVIAFESLKRFLMVSRNLKVCINQWYCHTVILLCGYFLMSN